MQEKKYLHLLLDSIGRTKDEVAMLPMDVFFELVVDVFKRKEFVGFMKAVSR